MLCSNDLNFGVTICTLSVVWHGGHVLKKFFAMQYSCKTL